VREILLVDCETDQPVAYTTEFGDGFVHNRRSPGRESPSQDAVGLWDIPKVGLVLAVADGLGGAPSGEAASALAIETLGSFLSKALAEGSLPSLIIDAFHEANRAVLGLGVGAGTTLVVAYIHGGVLQTFHVGDSESIVVGQRGKLKLQTISHSPVGYGVAAGLIDPDEALQHEDRHYLLNYLGFNGMHIQVGSPLQLAPRDTVLLASDGLFDNFLRGEIIDAIRIGPLARQSQFMARTCIERMTSTPAGDLGKPDDLSFILFRPRVSR